MTNDNIIDRNGIDSDRLTDEMRETIDRALTLLTDYLDHVNGAIPPSNAEGDAVTREDCYFAMDEEDVLYDAWQMLRYCGLSKDALEPLTRAIEADTIYEEESLDWFFENVVLASDD